MVEQYGYEDSPMVDEEEAAYGQQQPIHGIQVTPMDGEDLEEAKMGASAGDRD